MNDLEIIKEENKIVETPLEVPPKYRTLIFSEKGVKGIAVVGSFKEEKINDPGLEVPPNKKYTTLVLSGGAIKGIAIIGALFYFEKEGKLSNIINYIGTSVGSIICYLLCIGYTPFELIHFLCRSNFLDEFQHVNLGSIISQQGLIDFEDINKYLESLSIQKIGYLPTLSDVYNKLNKNLEFITYNLTSNKIEYLNKDTHPNLSCSQAIRMSSNIPIVFSRCFYNESEYIDGGIVDNFPMYYACEKYLKEENAESALGIDVTAIYEFTQNMNYLVYLFQLIMTTTMNSYFQKKPLNTDRHTIIRIQAKRMGLDFNISIPGRLDLFSIGYQTAKESIGDQEEC